MVVREEARPHGAGANRWGRRPPGPGSNYTDSWNSAVLWSRVRRGHRLGRLVFDDTLSFNIQMYSDSALDHYGFVGRLGVDRTVRERGSRSARARRPGIGQFAVTPDVAHVSVGHCDCSWASRFPRTPPRCRTFGASRLSIRRIRVPRGLGQRQGGGNGLPLLGVRFAPLEPEPAE